MDATKVAIVIVNYNMPERTDALAEYISHNVRWPHDLIVVDNGSDQQPSRFTSITLGQNVQTTNGWLAGLQYANALAIMHNENYLAYWMMITSAAFVGGGDVLRPMASWLVENPDAVGIHPALTPQSTTSWKHLITRSNVLPMPPEPRKTWMIDNIAALWRASWFDYVGNFDQELVYGWGVDLETCWKARSSGFTLWVDERVRMEKITDIGYTMRRMGMSADERQRLASQNMTDVLRRRYGPEWWEKMTKDGVYDDLQ